MNALTQGAPPAGVFAQGTFDWGSVTTTGIVLNNNVSETEWLKLTEAALNAYEYHGTGFARAALYAADLLNWGEEHLGERYAQAIDGTRAFLSRKEKTIANWRWVASKIAPTRRRESIDSLSIYETVASLEPEEQDELLELSERENLTVAELRKLIADRHPKTKRGKTRASKNGSTPHVEITNVTEAKTAATLLSNWLTANEEKITPGPLLDILGHFSKLYRRITDKGRKR